MKVSNQYGVLKTNALKLLYALNRLEKSGVDGITSRDLISFMNSGQFLDTIGSAQQLSEGSIYGTLSRLRSKGHVKKFLKDTKNGDDLVYRITGSGEKNLDMNLSGVRQQITKIDDFSPSFTPAF